jgi:mRNA interferase MazF
MNESQTYRHGDIVMVSFPFVSDPAQAKVRPAVILQNDVGNRFSPNLIVAAISSQIPAREYPTNLIVQAGSPEAAGTGLNRDSVVHAEIILTIPKASVARKLGKFSDEAMAAIDTCVRVSLGLS